MEELKYFFSYAREDSEAVLKLARELRAVNVKLWLDQLDIFGGQRWDRAVEEALETCQGMIVFLSPASVASHNVMDEVSYALDEEKLVVPILLRSCAIPFRLRRLQYINFTASYETGFSQLLRALRIDEHSQPLEPAAPQEPLIRDVSVPSKETPQAASSLEQLRVEMVSSEPEAHLAQEHEIPLAEALTTEAHITRGRPETAQQEEQRDLKEERATDASTAGLHEDLREPPAQELLEQMDTNHQQARPAIREIQQEDAHGVRIIPVRATKAWWLSRRVILTVLLPLSLIIIAGFSYNFVSFWLYGGSSFQEEYFPPEGVQAWTTEATPIWYKSEGSPEKGIWYKSRPEEIPEKGSLPKGTPLRLLGAYIDISDGEMYHVTANNRQGYVESRFISRNSPK